MPATAGEEGGLECDVNGMPFLPTTYLLCPFRRVLATHQLRPSRPNPPIAELYITLPHSTPGSTKKPDNNLSLTPAISLCPEPHPPIHSPRT